MVTSKRAPQRSDALSKERIIDAAIEILDAEGEAALTFRALTTRLATGAGAIYWHVPNKEALLAETTARIIGDAATRTADDGPSPQNAVRDLALGLFDALEAHPWVGAQLSREPWQASGLLILERIGRQLKALGLVKNDLFNAATALLSYILGLAGQQASRARLATSVTSRTAFLSTIAENWSALDADEHPFLRELAVELADHDDRAQFLAGIDLLLAGITASR
jgi:AcrR family transcriptional regulator